MFAPIIVPPLVVWIALTYGWRWVFILFAIPGIFSLLFGTYLLEQNQRKVALFHKVN